MKNRFKLKGCFIFALILTLIMSTTPVMVFAETTTDKWVTKAPMVTPRYNFQTAVVDGKIYAIGGQNGSNALATVEVYDPITNKWAAKASMSTPRNGFLSEVVNGKIYAIGGSSNSGTTLSVEKYDPISDTWTYMTPLSEAKNYNSQIAVLDGKIYVMGGLYNSSVEEYDPENNVWAKKAPMTTARSEFRTSVINNKIYAIGGHSSNTDFLSSVEEYDPIMDKWTIKASMSTARVNFQTKLINGKVYAIGGFTSRSGESALNSAEIYNPLSNSWSPAGSMPTPRGLFQEVESNGYIYAIGGRNSNAAVSAADKYDLASNTWTNVASMSTARIAFQTELVDGKIYAIGGLDNNSNSLSSVEEYNPVSSQPDSPITLTATAGDKQVSLSWSSVTGATGYNIYRSTTSDGSYSKIATGVTSTNYTDTGLTNGVTYYYYVKAVDSSGVEGQPSNEASATPTASSSGGYNATLRITMVTGETKEYNVTSTVVENFINWFNGKGSESPVFTFEKMSDLGPYTSHTDYLAYDKISSFIVLKY